VAGSIPNEAITRGLGGRPKDAGSPQVKENVKDLRRGETQNQVRQEEPGSGFQIQSRKREALEGKKHNQIIDAAESTKGNKDPPILEEIQTVWQSRKEKEHS